MKPKKNRDIVFFSIPGPHTNYQELMASTKFSQIYHSGNISIAKIQATFIIVQYDWLSRISERP